MAHIAPDTVRVCRGIKLSGRRRLICGRAISNPEVINEVNALLNEFLHRIEVHKNLLFNETITPFDYAVNALHNWLMGINEIDKFVKTNVNKALTRICMSMLKLLRRARVKWLRMYRSELEKLINNINSGKVKVIVTGYVDNEGRSFAVHLYTRNITIEISRVRLALR